MDPGQAAEPKQLFTISNYLTMALYNFEYCNVVPAGYDSQFRPLYQRNKAGGWDLIPQGSWDQIGYPGPSHKEPDYASDYDGLRVTIADDKVKFQS